MKENTEAIRDARTLGIPKMLLLGVQHMFAMFPPLWITLLFYQYTILFA